MCEAQASPVSAKDPNKAAASAKGKHRAHMHIVYAQPRVYDMRLWLLSADTRTQDILRVT